MSNADVDARRRAAAHVLLDAEASLDQQRLTLPDDVEHHLLRVVRMRDGEVLSATNGAGSWRLFRVQRVGGTLVAEAEGEVEYVPRRSMFAIACAIPKGDRVEWMVQKTTELGVDRVVLIDAERSVVRWKTDRVANQVIRLQRIADEATRQSRRVWRTVVESPVPAVDVLPAAAIAEPGGELIRGDEAMIAVGPEGGWSSDEIALSRRHVTLGDNILRVETAAVAAATLRMVGRH
jgi:16S rRNA (uracil1498-N3)-methyltransferase